MNILSYKEHTVTLDNDAIQVPVWILVSYNHDHEDIRDSINGQSHDLGPEYSDRFLPNGDLTSVCIKVDVILRGKSESPNLDNLDSDLSGSDIVCANHVSHGKLMLDVEQAIDDHNMIELALEEFEETYLNLFDLRDSYIVTLNDEGNLVSQ